MIRYIAIDPSSTDTGWSVFDSGRLIAWGTIKVGKLRFSERFLATTAELEVIRERYGFIHIAIEETKFAWGAKNRQRNIAGLQAVYRTIVDWAKEKKLPVFSYNVSTWKSAMCGFVHATKERVGECVGFRVEGLPKNLNEHEYDSIGIGLTHAGHLERLEMIRVDPGPIVDCMTGKELLAAAKVGINALVDEATEYEKVRPADALQKQMKNELKKGRKNV